MSWSDNLEPAFPGPFTNDSDMNDTAPDGQLVPPGYTVHMQGMSIRDWLAGQALAGGLEQGVEDDANVLTGPDSDAWWHSPSKIARRAYAIADAMMEARGRQA